MARFGRVELVEVPPHLVDVLREQWIGWEIVPCSHHVLVQHRDMHPPWCNRCGFDNLGIKYLKEKEPMDTTTLSGKQAETINPNPLLITSGQNLQKRAMDLVASYITSHLEITDETPDFEVRVVWFSKVLKNWKALVSSSLPDGMYYEVTYDGNMSRTYIDAYKKFNNVCIKDE